MPTVGASDRLLLRADGHRAKFYLSVLQPATALAALVNNAGIARGARSIDYDTGAGDIANVVAGQTLWVGTAAGQRDVGAVRIKSITGTTATGTLSVAENGIDWQDNLYLTVKETYELWAVPQRFDAGGNVWMDYDVAYTDQNLKPPPVAIAGHHRAGRLKSGSVTFNLDAGDSYAIAAGATITGYRWACTGGTIAAPTAASTTITFTAAGQYWLSLTVTDSNGKTQTTRRAIFVHDTANPPRTDFAVENFGGSWEQGGWRARFNIYGDADIAAFPDGTLVVLWADTFFGGTEKHISFSDEVLFAGYITTDTTAKDWDTGTVTFEAATIEAVMKTMLLRSSYLDYTAAPSTWREYANLTNARALHFLWRWSSTLFDIADVFLPMSDSLLRKGVDFEMGSLYRQAETVVRQYGIQAHAVCDKAGRLHVNTDIQLPDDATRAALTQTYDIIAADRRDTITFVRRPQPRVAQVVLSGVAFDGTTGTAYRSFAPGETLTAPGASIRSVERQTLQDQAQTNALAGRLLAVENNTFREIRVPFAGNYLGVLEPALAEWWTMSLAAADTTRGIVWSFQKLKLLSVSCRFDFERGTQVVDGVFEKEAEGPDGVTGNYPLPPSTGGDALITDGVLASGSLWYLPAGSNTWQQRTADAVNALVVDPYWRARQGSDSPAQAIILRGGAGSMKRSVDGGDTWSAVSPATAPPNTWGDSPAPGVADVTFAVLGADANTQGTFWAVATWQNAVGDRRSWLAKTTDDGANWSWV